MYNKKKLTYGILRCVYLYIMYVEFQQKCSLYRKWAQSITELHS